MKTDIKERKSDTVQGMLWYSWIEKCDTCGKLIHNHHMQTTKAPDTSEEDLCISCLEERLGLRHKSI